jgi:hypothetical protein
MIKEGEAATLSIPDHREIAKGIYCIYCMPPYIEFLESPHLTFSAINRLAVVGLTLEPSTQPTLDFIEHPA